MTKEEISKLIYDELSYAYCNNCRNNHCGDYHRCEDCHRKYNNWAVSKEKCDSIAEKIKDGEQDDLR